MAHFNAWIIWKCHQLYRWRDTGRKKHQWHTWYFSVALGKGKALSGVSEWLVTASARVVLALYLKCAQRKRSPKPCLLLSLKRWSQNLFLRLLLCFDTSYLLHTSVEGWHCMLNIKRQISSGVSYLLRAFWFCTLPSFLGTINKFCYGWQFLLKSKACAYT